MVQVSRWQVLQKFWSPIVHTASTSISIKKPVGYVTQQCGRIICKYMQLGERNVLYTLTASIVNLVLQKFWSPIMLTCMYVCMHLQYIHVCINAHKLALTVRRNFRHSKRATEQANQDVRRAKKSYTSNDNFHKKLFEVSIRDLWTRQCPRGQHLKRVLRLPLGGGDSFWENYKRSKDHVSILCNRYATTNGKIRRICRSGNSSRHSQAVPDAIPIYLALGKLHTSPSQISQTSLPPRVRTTLSNWATQTGHLIYPLSLPLGNPSGNLILSAMHHQWYLAQLQGRA